MSSSVQPARRRLRRLVSSTLALIVLGGVAAIVIATVTHAQAGLLPAAHQSSAESKAQALAAATGHAVVVDADTTSYS